MKHTCPIDSTFSASMTKDNVLEIGLHYYDLSRGFMKKHAREVVDGPLQMPNGKEIENGEVMYRNQLLVNEGNFAEDKIKPNGLRCSFSSTDKHVLPSCTVNRNPQSKYGANGLRLPAHASENFSVICPPMEKDIIHRKYSVLHSAVVGYGFEYFFEGGIGRSPRGRARFGHEYEYLPIGQTTVPMEVFERWCIAGAEQSDLEDNQLQDLYFEAGVGNSNISRSDGMKKLGARFGFPMYSPTEYNCHEFTIEAICFLFSEGKGWFYGDDYPENTAQVLKKDGVCVSNEAPKVIEQPIRDKVLKRIGFIIENANQLIYSSLVRPFIPLNSRINSGLLFVVSQLLHKHEVARVRALTRAAACGQLVEVIRHPCKAAFLFGSSNAAHVEKVILNIVSCVDFHTDQYVPSDTVISSVLRMARLFSQLKIGMDRIQNNNRELVQKDFPHNKEKCSIENSGIDERKEGYSSYYSIHSTPYIDPEDILRTLAALGQLLDNRHFHNCTELLDSWRMLVLHSTVASHIVFDSRLNIILMRLSYDFMDMSPKCQLTYLRLLCNYFSCPQGGYLMIDSKRVDLWIFVINSALCDVKEPAIQHAGATLTYNLVMSFVVLYQTSLDEDVQKHRSNNHVIVRIITVILYHVMASRISDNPLLKLLMALNLLCAQGKGLTAKVASNPISLNIRYLLETRVGDVTPTTDRDNAQLDSNDELKSLLCTLSGFLAMSENSGDITSDDCAEWNE